MNAARTALVAGNWKMNTDLAGGQALAREVATAIAAHRAGQAVGATVVVCPPLPYLISVASALAGVPGHGVALGAQNLYVAKSGAYTGEVSAGMLTDCGCRYVIIGHSERRHTPELAETDALINAKVKAALEAGLTAILCVGETLAERDANKTLAVVTSQLRGGLAGLTAAAMAGVVIAYEPVWAIGTGRNATPDQAQEVHAAIRGELAGLLDASTAQATRVLYGGSVKADNAAALLTQPDVDGALVGGASLKAADFVAIVRAAQL